MIDGVLTIYSKGEKVTAKAHGGLIDIQGVTVAEVDEKIRMRAIQTWMDPLEMFRQIAPHGVVKKETINRKVDLEAALDDSDSGIVVATEDNHEAVSQENLPARMSDAVKPEAEPTSCQISGLVMDASGTDSSSAQREEAVTVPSTSGNTDTSGSSANIQYPEEVSLLEACAIVEAAKTHASEMDVEKPESNAPEVTQALPPAPVPASAYEYIPSDQVGDSIADVPRSLYSSSITGNVEDVLLSAQRGVVKDESKAADMYDVVDEYLEKPAEMIHPVGHEVLPVGHALAAAPHSEETRIAHEEMSGMSAFECPFLQNRE